MCVRDFGACRAAARDLHIQRESPSIYASWPRTLHCAALPLLLQAISHAYEVLSDEERRRAYDQFGFAGLEWPEFGGPGPSRGQAGECPGEWQPRQGIRKAGRWLGCVISPDIVPYIVSYIVLLGLGASRR